MKCDFVDLRGVSSGVRNNYWYSSLQRVELNMRVNTVGAERWSVLLLKKARLMKV